MEGLYSGLRRTARTLETDATLRLQNRSQGNPNPNAFENFGSTLRVAPSSSQTQPKSKPKPRSTVSREPARIITIKKPLITIKKPLSDFYDSQDELDLLSSPQSDPDDYQPSNKASVSQPSKYVDGNGKGHDYDPKFPSRKSQVLSKLKFSKTKKLDGKDNATIPSSCSFKNQPDPDENSQDFGSWANELKKKGADKQATGECSGDDDILEISSPLPLKSSNQRLSPPQPTPKQPIHKLPDGSLPTRPGPKPLPLPRPRPAYKSNADAGSKPGAVFIDGHELFPLGRAKTATDAKGKGPYHSTSLSISTPKKKDGPGSTTTDTKGKGRYRSPSLSVSTPKEKDGPSSQPSSPKNFPMDMISPLGGKVQRKPLPKPKNKVNPLSSESEMSRKLSMFPMPSPQSNKKVGTSQPKGKNKAKPFPLDESDEDEADEENDLDEGKGRAKAKRKPKRTPSSPKNFPMDMISPFGRKKLLPKPRSKVKSPSIKASRKPRAFPMPSPQSSDKASIRPTFQSKGKRKAQPFPEEGLSKHQKRTSESCSDDERQSKKRRSSLSPSQYSSEEEGDSITISPGTDPRTLCPYCDTPLPSSPSPLLVNILAATRKKSTRDPRPSNPLGLKAPLAIFIVACQRHKFESQILPEAERKGWPKTIQWKKLGARVERMKDELQALIEDPGGEREHEDVDEDIDEVERLFRNNSDGTRQKGPKARSIFWTEVMDEVKKKGSRAVVGVQGQFANFEKTQPGYYGEQGSVIIHQTLFDMFPPASFNPTRILPLTSNEFVLRILVPEVALRLIMEDRDLGIHEALIVLRESSAYGVAMFPEDGGEGSTGKKRRDDAMCVGDKIVMERARKRRKELEEEEEQEEREEARRIAEMEADIEMQQAEVKTPVRKHSRPPDHGAKDTSDDEQTPKPSIYPLIGGSKDIKPLMIARMRQSQKSDSESKFGEADMPCRLRNDERPNLRATRIEDTTDTEVESLKDYCWLLNDTSQSSTEGKNTSRRRHY